MVHSHAMASVTAEPALSKHVNHAKFCLTFTLRPTLPSFLCQFWRHRAIAQACKLAPSYPLYRPASTALPPFRAHASRLLAAPHRLQRLLLSPNPPAYTLEPMLGPHGPGSSPAATGGHARGHAAPAAAAAAAAGGPGPSPALPANAAAHAAQCSFSIKAREGAARTGVLRLPSGRSVHTPLSLLYTRRGAHPHLTPDMIARLKPMPTTYQIDILQFLAGPNPDILAKFGKGARGFLAMEGADLVLASNRDPGQYEYGAKPNGDKALYCTIHAGGRTVTPEGYMDVVAALQPDLYVTMCDELTADAKLKSVKASVNRTKVWLDACLKLQQTRNISALPLAAIAGAASETERSRSAAQAASAADAVAGFALCGFGTGEDPAPAVPLLVSDPNQAPRAPGESSEAAAESAGAAAAGAAVAGAAAGAEAAGAGTATGAGTAAGVRTAAGAHAGEGAAAPGGRVSLLRAVIGQLPESKPRFISGVSSPAEVLDTVAEGVDVFDNAYVTTVTTGGYALSFPFQPPSKAQPSTPDGSTQPPGSTAGSDGSAVGPSGFGDGLAGPPGFGDGPAEGADPCKVNLWSSAYRTDKRPLVPGCGCFACQHHSRAYIHHLLQVHEMVAEVLLEMHNTHHYHAFMAEVRKSIEEGTFTQYRRWFRSNLGPTQVWAPPTPDASGQGPEPADGPVGGRGNKRAGTEEEAGPGDQAGKKGRWQAA